MFIHLEGPGLRTFLSKFTFHKLFNMSESETSDDVIEVPMDEKESSDSSDVEMIEDPNEKIPEHSNLSAEQIASLAEEKKLKGNELYKSKKYNEALEFYSEAIGLCPNCAAYYSNRSATYMMLRKFAKALEDARRSTQIDPNFIKGHSREAKCHLVMGEVAAAVMSYQQVLRLEPGNKVAASECQSAQLGQQYIAQAFKCFDNEDYRQVVFCMNKLIDICPECTKFKVMKAESLALLRRYQESQELANDMLRREPMNADAIYVRGMCLYYQDNPDKAFQHFQHVLRLAPDHQKARSVYRKAKNLMQKKEEGNTAFRSGKLDQAYDLYTDALAIDPHNVFTNSKLYCNRATVLSKLKREADALQDCSKAIELDDTYIKAYLRRARCHTELENYEDAVRDYEKVYKMDKTRENKRLVNEAKLELKKSKRKDYYKILGVAKTATDDEIKKAYRKRALLHHPDRHSNASEAEKKEEEKKFKECGEAYTVLSDAKKKARYDSGQDLEEMGGMDGFGDIDPNQIFQTFFSGNSFGGGGSGGFPGFTFQFG